MKNYEVVVLVPTALLVRADDVDGAGRMALESTEALRQRGSGRALFPPVLASVRSMRPDEVTDVA